MTEEKQNQYFTFDQISKKYPIFTLESLRWYRHKNINNFNRCVRKIGRKCIISLLDFEEWLKCHMKAENE